MKGQMMNMQTQTDAADFLASRAFFQSPAMATRYEDKVGDLIRAHARDGKHMKGVPHSPREAATPLGHRTLIEVREYRKAHPQSTTAEISLALKISPNAARQRLWRLKAMGDVPPPKVPLYMRMAPAIKNLRADGLSIEQIARRLNTSGSTVSRALGLRK